MNISFMHFIQVITYEIKNHVHMLNNQNNFKKHFSWDIIYELDVFKRGSKKQLKVCFSLSNFSFHFHVDGSVWQHDNLKFIINDFLHTINIMLH